mgnify:CR=1 FL=1
MDNILKTVRINDLLNIYSSQLSDTQREILENYFVYDLSMSEIAEDRSISRAAVEDAIKKGSKKLETLESELHLLEKREALLKAAKSIKENTNDEKIISIAEEIERIID